MDYEVARARMLKEQLIKRGIVDQRVITAMGSVPRHLFVDQAFWPRAYGDYPLPIGNDQTISQPYIVALMSQELGVSKGSRILEIGTGSGYQGAVLAMMGCSVFTIERHAELSQKAEALIKNLGISGVKFKVGDGTLGWAEESPYDGIIVTAGAPAVPQDLIAQLNVGGKLIIPVGDRDSQRMQIIEKGENIIEKREITGCTFVPLVGKKGWNNE
ncbi:protein-L-isoaspartate(D-aspartate) O-methyltransferase [Candidatus Latescibacterota bacterium]